MVFGLFAVITLPFAFQTNPEQRYQEFAELADRGFGGINRTTNMRDLLVKDEGDFFDHCVQVRSNGGSITLDTLSGYIPFAYFHREDFPTEPDRERREAIWRNRVQQICDAVGYGSAIRLWRIDHPKLSDTQVFFAPTHNGVRYDNWHVATMDFHPTHGWLTDLSLRWYPAPPARTQPGIVADQARLAAARWYLLSGRTEPMAELMPMELVIGSDYIINAPAVPRPTNTPAMRPDIVGKLSYHVIYTGEDRRNILHLWIDPFNGQITRWERPNQGSSAGPAGTSQPTPIPKSGFALLVGKDGAAKFKATHLSPRPKANQDPMEANAMISVGGKVFPAIWRKGSKAVAIRNGKDWTFWSVDGEMKDVRVPVPKA